MPTLTRAWGSWRVRPVHVVALLVGHHLEGQLVVVAEEQRPLRVGRCVGRLGQDVDDREAVLLPRRHEDPRHQRKVEGHVAEVALSQVGDRVLGPLVGLGEQHAAGEALVDVCPQPPEELEGLGQVLRRGALAGEQVGHGVEPEAVHAHLEPIVDDVDDGVLDVGVVVVEAGLVRVEAVPEVGLRDGIPGPVGRLEVLEDDAGLGQAVGRVAPEIEVSRLGPGTGVPGPLEPGVLVGRVGQDELGDDA